MAKKPEDDANDPFARPTAGGPVSDALREHRPPMPPLGPSTPDAARGQASTLQPYVGQPGDPPAFPPGYGGRTTWTKAPLGIGEAALWATGAATLGSVFVAFAAPGYINATRMVGRHIETWTVYDTFVTLTQVAMLGGWVLLALWMYKANVYRRAQGTSLVMPPLMSWFGWIIPVGALVIPVICMRDTQRSDTQLSASGNLWLWWGCWLAANALFVWGTNVSDAFTGDVNWSIADSFVGIAATNAIALGCSWWGLRGLVMRFAVSVRTPS